MALSSSRTFPGHTLAERRKKIFSAVGGDRELLVELAEIFLADAPPNVQQLTEAVKAGDFENAARHAHKLRGSAAIFSADDLSEAAMTIERLARAGTVVGAAPAVDDLTHAYGELAELLSGIVAAEKKNSVPVA